MVAKGNETALRLLEALALTKITVLFSVDNYIGGQSIYSTNGEDHSPYYCSSGE